MIILDTTTRSLEVVLAGSVAANQLPVVACYSDFTDGYAPGASQTQTNNTTTPLQQHKQATSRTLQRHRRHPPATASDRAK